MESTKGYRSDRGRWQHGPQSSWRGQAAGKGYRKSLGFVGRGAGYMAARQKGFGCSYTDSRYVFWMRRTDVGRRQKHRPPVRVRVAGLRTTAVRPDCSISPLRTYATTVGCKGAHLESLNHNSMGQNSYKYSSLKWADYSRPRTDGGSTDVLRTAYLMDEAFRYLRPCRTGVSYSPYSRTLSTYTVKEVNHSNPLIMRRAIFHLTF